MRFRLALLVSPLLAAACAATPVSAPASYEPTSASTSATPPARRSASTLQAKCKERFAAARDPGPSPAASRISDADTVIGDLRSKFRRCYQKGLNVDPTMQGCVLVDAMVSPLGDVDRSHASVAEGLSVDVAECIVSVVREAKFSAPGGDGALLRIPVTFVQLEK